MRSESLSGTTICNFYLHCSLFLVHLKWLGEDLLKETCNLENGKLFADSLPPFSPRAKKTLKILSGADRLAKHR